MANINVITRRKQMTVFIACCLGLSAIGGIAWYIGQPTKSAPSQKSAKKPVPNLTGTVNSTSFDRKVSQSAVADLQHTATEADKKLKAFDNRLKKMEGDNKGLREKIQDQEDEIKLLQTQLEAAQQFNNRAFDEPFPASAPLPVGAGAAASPTANGEVLPPGSFYPGQGMPANQTNWNVSPQLGMGLSSMSVNYLDEEDEAPELPYLPSGSFASAMVIEGADANASVTGSNSPSPMQFRLTGKVIMPNDEEYDLTSCFVTAAAYGDISSERALVRTDRLSCRIDGRTIDQPFEGHVSFMGKNGIRAEPVIRNGKVVGYAFAGGAVDSMGSAISSIGSTTVGLGAANTVSGGDVARAGIGGGTSQAGKTLSDYFIKRAEQYHPVIPVGAGVDVTVVFQKGFQLEFAEKMKKAKPEPIKEAAKTGITITREALKDLKLGDIVTPEIPR